MQKEKKRGQRKRLQAASFKAKNGDRTCLVAAWAIAHPVNLEKIAWPLTSHRARIGNIWFRLFDPGRQCHVESDVGD